MPVNAYVAYAIAVVEAIHVQLIADIDAVRLVMRRRARRRRQQNRLIDQVDGDHNLVPGAWRDGEHPEEVHSCTQYHPVGAVA